MNTEMVWVEGKIGHDNVRLRKTAVGKCRTINCQIGRSNDKGGTRETGK